MNKEVGVTGTGRTISTNTVKRSLKNKIGDAFRMMRVLPRAARAAVGVSAGLVFTIGVAGGAAGYHFLMKRRG
jgi:hypothetical protein